MDRETLFVIAWISVIIIGIIVIINYPSIKDPLSIICGLLIIISIVALYIFFSDKNRLKKKKKEMGQI